MNKQITVSFHLNDPVFGPESWMEGEKEYLLFNFLHPENYIALFADGPPFLIISADNSDLISQIKNRQKGNIFTTSLANLQYKPNFLNLAEGKGPESWWVSGLVVKDTNQMKKVNGTGPTLPLITFKVISQRKLGHVEGTTYQESFQKYGSYNHELEIEPLDLRIEGIPPITRLVFDFADPTQPTIWKPLTKMKLYNSNILTESVGKQFTMQVKSWKFTDKGSNNILHFSSDWDFEWDSFQEKTGGKNRPGQPNNPPSLNQPKNDNNPTTPGGNKKLIIGVVIILTLIIAFLLGKGRKKLKNSI